MAPLRERLRPRRLAQKRNRIVVAALAYVLVAGICIGVERARLLDAVQALEQAYVHDEVLVRAVVAVSQASLDITGATYGASDVQVRPEALEAVESARVALIRLGEIHAPAGRWARAIGDRTRALRDEPARSSWILLRELVRDVKAELAAHRSAVTDRVEAQRQRVLRIYDVITWTWALIGALGVAGVALVAGGFLSRLTGDLARLERRAGEIVAGYRGAPLDLGRDDEVQRLAHAVNRMADDLRQREAKLALDEQRRAYDEKMLALRALAAGVSHEVNNPLTGIAAVAEDLAAEGRRRGDAAVADRALTILSDVHRAAAATRALSGLAVPQPAQPEWIDCNDLARRTAGLLFHDPRFRRVALALRTAPDLPAVHTAPALLQQALFDLVVGAAGTAGPDGGRLELRTRGVDDGVALDVDVATDTATAAGVVVALSDDGPADAAGPHAALLRARAAARALHAALVATTLADGLALTLALPRDAHATAPP